MQCFAQYKWAVEDAHIRVCLGLRATALWVGRVRNSIFHEWRQEMAMQARFKRKLGLVVRNIKVRVMQGSLAGWRESYLLRCKHQTNLHRSKRRFLSRIFTMWVDMFLEVLWERGAERKACGKCRASRVCANFWSWADAVARVRDWTEHEMRLEHVVRKGLMKVFLRSLAVVFDKWHFLSKEKRRHARIVLRLITVVTRHTAIRTLSEWHLMTSEVIRMRHSIYKLAARLQHRDLAAAFDEWLQSFDMCKLLAKASSDENTRALEMEGRKRKIELRLLHKTQAEAMQQWIEHLQESKRTHTILSRSIARLQNRSLAVALSMWTSNVVEEKQLKHKALKVVQKLLNRVFVEGFERWHGIAVHLKTERAEARRKEAIQRKILLRIINRTQAEAMQQWIEHLQESKRTHTILSRSIARLQNRSLAVALSMWTSNVVEEKQLKHKALKVVQKLLNRVFVEGFERWHGIAVHLKTERAEARRKEAIQRKILLRIINRTQAEAMQQWRYNVSEARARASRSLRAVSRWANRALFQSMEQWILRLEQGRRLRQTLSRMRNRAAFGAWECWKEHMAEQKELRFKGRKIVQRLTHRGLAQAFDQWMRVVEILAAEHSDESRKSFVIKKVVLRIVHRLLASAVSRWVQKVTDAGRMRFILTRTLARMKHCMLAASMSLWSFKMHEHRILKAKYQRVFLRLKNGCLSKSFDLWIETSMASRLRQDDQNNRDAKMRKVISRLVHRCIALSFQSWWAFSAHERRLRTKLSSALVRVMRRGLCAAYLRWVDVLRREQELRRLALRTVLYIAKRLLVAQFGWWRYQVDRCKHIRSHVSKSVMRAQGCLAQGALLDWKHATRQDVQVRKMVRMRFGEVSLRAFLSWDQFVWQSKVMHGKGSKLVLRSVTGIRRTVLAAWEDQAHDQRRKVLAVKKAVDRGFALLHKQTQLIFREWQRLWQTMSVRRARAAGKMTTHGLKSCANSWEEWLHTMRLRSFRLRLVCFGVICLLRPVVVAWHQVAHRRRFLRHKMHKALSRLTLKSLRTTWGRWTTHILTETKHSQVSRRIRKSASALTMRMVMWSWHKAARIYAIRDRWSARISLSEPRMGHCAPRRADRAWQRAILFEWLQVIDFGLARRRLTSALVTRWIFVHMQRIVGEWHARACLRSAVARLSGRVEFYRCMLVLAQVVGCWRVNASKAHVKRESLHIWRKAAHDKYVHRRSAEFRIQHTRESAICELAVGNWLRWRSARMWFNRAWLYLRRLHVVRVKRHVISFWRRVSMYHAHIARASAVLICKTVARCARKAFCGMELVCERAERRHRAGAVGVNRHRSFLQHDAFRVWSLRQNQSARYWATVERRFIRYLSRVIREWLASALRQRRFVGVCAASRNRLERRNMQECTDAWRGWCRVIAKAFAKSCLVSVCLRVSASLCGSCCLCLSFSSATCQK